ncbi:hypothetical protein BHE74_00016640 [Ensete ventricosum]|nr:hypothetical protein BHE74_00016640 [Ensete ventricosum]
MKQTLVGRAPCPGPSPSLTDPTAEASATCELECLAKKKKVLNSKAPSSMALSHIATITPLKEAPTAVVPRKAAPLKVPRGEGVADKGKRQCPNPGICTISTSLELSCGVSPSLPRRWRNRAEAQLFCRGLLCHPLAKEVYTTPSEALLDNIAKNLVMKLKEETGPMVVVTAKARVSKMTQRLEDLKSQLEEAEH